jgi:uncharacterized membrane protein
VQRRALGVLFLAIALALGAISAWSSQEGGRAWVVCLAAAGLALWMADLARKAFRR